MSRLLSVSLYFLTLVLALQVQTASAQLGKAKYDERVKRILDQQGINYQIDADGDFKLVREVGTAGRTQLAYIRSATNTYNDLEIREIWSPAYKTELDLIPVDVANMLLEDNSKKKMGAWHKKGQHAMFVIQIDADCNLETLISALNANVSTADSIEEQLSGSADQF